MKSAFLTILSLLVISSSLFAYPPDNAAVLYYKHMEHFDRPDKAIWDELTDLPTSNKPASEEVKALIQRHKKNHLIPELEIASELKHCDWGIDVSQGFEMLMPGLSNIKSFMYLLLADGAIAAQEGDIEAALDKNLVTRRMAHHVSNDTLIGFLVSSALNRKSDDALRHLLGTYAIDEKTLAEFKNELLWESYRPKPIRHPLMMEKEVCLLETSIMTPERYKKCVAGWGGTDTDEEKEMNKRVLEYLKDIDSASRERSATIFSKYYDNIFTIMEKPYTQAYVEIDAESEKMCDNAKEDDDAILPAIFCPALAKCYNYGINWKTNYDAMLTALDIYIIAAKTGNLPEELPKSTYIDHFSGKPFIYEVTEDGFILRCQQEDLSKKVTHEFTYKLPH